MDASTVLATVTQNASRGCGRLYVASTMMFSMNGWVRLVMDNPSSNSLAADMHSGLFAPEAGHANRANLVMAHMRITEVSRKGMLLVKQHRSLLYWGPMGERIAL